MVDGSVGETGRIDIATAFREQNGTSRTPIMPPDQAVVDSHVCFEQGGEFCNSLHQGFSKVIVR